MTAGGIMADKKIRVLVADDFAVMREVINQLINRSDDIEVVGEAPDLQDALKDVQTLKPDVVLMNDYLPPTNSALATKLFRELDVTAAILIISIDVEPEMIQQSLANGANGFMHKDEMGTLLTEAIRKVYNNEQYLSQRTEYALANEND
jgi:DNA-binding NarL/FixJ family response regulator